MSMLNSLKNAIHNQVPFDHWELNEPLSEAAIQEIIQADIQSPSSLGLSYDGTRALDDGGGEFRPGIVDGGKASKFRVFVDKTNQNEFPALVDLIDQLASPEVYQPIGKLIGKDLSQSYVRLEVICDRQGFWLKPHCDIEEKLLSGLMFLNQTNESIDLGTDLYDSDLNVVKSVPFKHNYGYFFTSGPNTWHGLELKEIRHERRCLQFNYVTFPTDWPVKAE